MQTFRALWIVAIVAYIRVHAIHRPQVAVNQKEFPSATPPTASSRSRWSATIPSRRQADRSEPGVQPCPAVSNIPLAAPSRLRGLPSGPGRPAPDLADQSLVMGAVNVRTCCQPPAYEKTEP